MTAVRRLTGRIQDYAWGSTTAIPALLGIEPDGSPQAELWLGAHPSAPSTLEGDGTLAELIDRDPTVLGEESRQAFGPRLSYLLKILAAAQPLSLQAHPSREQAEVGFAREEAAGIARDAGNRMYRDDWPKPEIIVALEPFEALYGFADPERTAALVDRLGVAELSELFAPLRSPGGPVGLQQVFTGCCRLTDAATLVHAVVAAAAARVDDPDQALARFCRTTVELAEHYPGDPGVLAALTMNRMSLAEHEALFLPAGNLHAYLRGTGVELMANSDNVLRGGLTVKHVDVDELASVLDFSPTEPVALTAEEQSPGVWRYRTSAPEFALWRLEPTGDPIELPGSGSGRIVLATAGAPSVDGVELQPGSAGFVPADADPPGVTGHGRLFVAGPGVG